MPEMSSRRANTQSLIEKKLPELAKLERILDRVAKSPHAQVRVETKVSYHDLEFPIHSICFGSQDKSAPVLGIFGGVHGLERIGSEVAIAWLQTLTELLTWDETVQEKLAKSRIVFMPIVNPVGMFATRRSNGNGVDLMRNAPVVAERAPPFLLGGQVYSNRLPWFRGNSTSLETMEVESRTLCDFVMREVWPSKMALTLDIHSGFGTTDQLWFPYAKTTQPFPNLPEVVSLKRLFDASYPNHFYKIEPQAKNYTTHGDLWDWLYDQKLNSSQRGLFIPWTLELGSWTWLKKNPRQFFTSLGAFNPMQPHRFRRILRRHYTFFDFMHRALLSSASWSQLSSQERNQLERKGMELWYESVKRA